MGPVMRVNTLTPQGERSCPNTTSGCPTTRLTASNPCYPTRCPERRSVSQTPHDIWVGRGATTTPLVQDKATMRRWAAAGPWLERPSIHLYWMNKLMGARDHDEDWSLRRGDTFFSLLDESRARGRGTHRQARPPREQSGRRPKTRSRNCGGSPFRSGDQSGGRT